MKQSYLDSLLDDNEKIAVQQFMGSEVMSGAVKKVLLAGIYSNGTLKVGLEPNPLYNAAFSLASHKDYTALQVGEDVKALWEGINALEAGFNALGQFVTPQVDDKPIVNEAR